jgi:hypothetical protein
VGAFRVVLGLLTVLVFASPAVAQNLQGTWRFRSVAGIDNQGTICAAGSVTFNAAGAVIAPSNLQECNAAVPGMPLVGGSLTVGANSSVSGSIDIFDLQGTFLPAGDAFVAVSTVNPDGPTSFGLAVFVKDTTTTFAQSDLAATWRVHLIEGGEVPTTITEQAFGSIVIGPTGVITGGTLTFFGAEEGQGFSFRQVTGGNATINVDGVITATVFTIRAPGDDTVVTAFNGLMATDKKLVAGSLRVVDGEQVESGLALLQRQPPSTFAAGDIVGQWTLNHVILDAFSSEQATWLRGTVNIDAQGLASGTRCCFLVWGSQGGARREARDDRRPGVRGVLLHRRFEVIENLELELFEALTEGVAEIGVAILLALEGAEVGDDAREAVARDQVVGHQERELVRRQRALAQVANGEATWITERLQIKPRGHERRVVADAGGRHRAAHGHGVETQPLQHVERDPLRHALGQPLLGPALALGQLDLGDVSQLVRDQPEPLAAVRGPALVVQQELAALADADGELRQLGGADRRDVGVDHESALEALPARVHVCGERLRHRELEVAHQDRGDATNRLLVRGELGAAAGKDEG